MKYKLIVVDVDGTLVNDKKKITDKTAASIKKAQEENMLVTIASGRPLSGLKEYAKLFGDVYYITYNGASIQNLSGNVIYEKHINKKTSDEIINYCLYNEYPKNHNLNIIVWNDNILYVNQINDDILFYEKTSGMKATIFETFSFAKVNKIIIYGENEYLQEVKRYFQNNNNINCEFSSPNYLEFYDRNASKGNALEYLGKILKYSREELVAIGDNYNDLSMITYAGLGIAMGNSPQEIKDKSDLVTLTNEEDGVAYAIENYILK